MKKIFHIFLSILAFSIVADCPAQPPSSIPPYLIPELAKLNLLEVASLSYEDGDGLPISSEDFAALYKVNPKFSTKIMTDHRLPDLTLRLQKKRKAQYPFARLKVGEALPEFHLKRLDGSLIDNKALKGRYTLINFFSAGCLPCITQVPKLNALARHRKDVNLLAITDDSAAETGIFVARYELGWPIVADGRDLFDKIDVKAYPAMALFDPTGMLVGVLTGSEPLEQTAAFDAWLAKNTGAVTPPVDDIQGLPTTAAEMDLKFCPSRLSDFVMENNCRVR